MTTRWARVAEVANALNADKRVWKDGALGVLVPVNDINRLSRCSTYHIEGVDIPPRPSGERCRELGVELTGECRVPVEGEWWHNINDVVTDKLRYIIDDFSRRRWIARRIEKPAPAVVPWTAATLPKDRQVWVRIKGTEDCGHLITDYDILGVRIRSGGIAYHRLFGEYEQLDGSPCGERK